MDAVIDKLLNDYGTNGLVIAGIIVVFSILPKAIDFFKSIQIGPKKDSNEEQKLLTISNSSSNIINQEKEVQEYYRNTGIRANFYLIQNINALIEHSKGEITTRTVKMANAHLSNNRSGIIVTVDNFDIWIKRIFGFSFWLFVFINIILFFIIIYLSQLILLNFKQEYLPLLVIWFVLFIAVTYGMISFIKGRQEIIAAETIIDYIKKYKEEINATINYYGSEPLVCVDSTSKKLTELSIPLQNIENTNSAEQEPL